ncbi:MAG: Gfo/Idh/MocA family oxidoreductase [Ancrocorticia sp.]|uniref:Gfo/Idh/MocA family oxidoreductase n=1 Tax=Ancrocorticia sp. TaxID=2593684 RepID=UPI003F8E2AC4
MRTVITYGTYDMFHEGHRRLLERARELGDWLIVGVTSDSYDLSRGKLNVQQSTLERVENVRNTGLADQVLIEEYAGQKILDIQEWGVDVFAIGSDWLGKFDYLKDYCDVVYLDRTRGVSSTKLRNESMGIHRIGLVGAGAEAENLVKEARYVSGISVEAVWDPNAEKAASFASDMELGWAYESYPDLLSNVDAVYISTPVDSRPDMIRQALQADVRVLSESPLTLSKEETEELTGLAERKDLALVEGIRTAYTPGFQRMVAYARSGSIGFIRSVEATLTRVRGTEPVSASDAGAIAELAVYPLLTVLKLLGGEYTDVRCRIIESGTTKKHLFARIDLEYPRAVASVKVGIGVRAENDLEIAGTRGSLYVPAPWWRTQHYETRFEDANENEEFYDRLEGDEFRYELAELSSRIRGNGRSAYKLRAEDSVSIAEVVELINGTTPIKA